MIKYLLSVILFTPAVLFSQIDMETVYYGKDYFIIEGTIIPVSQKESPYDRLPASYKDIVRKPVWDLSKSSAGLAIRFVTDSPYIKVKWEVLNNFSMNHMPDTGVKGVDLYYKNNSEWQYINTGRPQGFKNQYTLIENMSNELKEFKIFLPLYDGVKNIEIGIGSSSSIEKAINNDKQPIVFYGTSITQGGCASRPGMAHTNIISRKLDLDVVNFGFSGNGRMEQPIAELISNVDAKLYIIECLPNMISPENITKKTIPLVNTIRKNNPLSPIVLIDLFKTPISILNSNSKRDSKAMDDALKSEFKKMIDLGYNNLYYLETPKIIDSDNEGTVDAIHFTDLGFLRYADFLIDSLSKLDLLDWWITIFAFSFLDFNDTLLHAFT